MTVKQFRVTRLVRIRPLRRRFLEAVAQPVLRYRKGTVLTVPNRCPSKLRLQPLRANDEPQGLKPPSFGSGFGTTKVVPLRRSEEVMQQLLERFYFSVDRKGMASAMP